MILKDFVIVLQDQLSSQSRILTDHESSEFKALSRRWSDLSSQIPGAIISLASEADVVHTVGEKGLLSQSNFRLTPVAGPRSTESIGTVCACYWRT